LTLRQTALAVAIAAGLAAAARAGTEIRVFRGAHEREVCLAKFRRGLFFGSCGPATRSLTAEYSFTLRGDGPVYRKESIAMRNGARQPVAVRAGSITAGDRTVTIDLSVQGKDGTIPFPWNGEYRFRP
jgi:hypothetical protein